MTLHLNVDKSECTSHLYFKKRSRKVILIKCHCV